MSMTAQFVQVSATRLATLIEEPEGIEELFGSAAVPAPTIAKLVNLGEEQRRRIVEQGPQMLERVLGQFSPQMREALKGKLERLGVDPAGLGKGQGGEALLKMMAARAGQGSGTGATANSGSSRGASISIDKSWHGVHYLLCGAPQPDATLISKVVMGGTDLGDDFSGYGEARYFDVGETAAIASELGRPTLEAEMTQRYDPARMTKLGIYPGVWTGPDLQWLMGEFRNLRTFYADASAKGLAMVTCLV